jgi:hypothetical protein
MNMKQFSKKFTFLLLTAFAISFLFSSCYTKKCGCGPDLNGLYKAKRNKNW